VAYSYLLLLTFMVMGVTLTLPGIAAFILGIGMAVDANIIMNERIREEMRVGKSMKASVRAGSKRSFLTIFDANITTIIAGAVLFIFGSAGVKGFSVTLIAGILVSFVTAVALSRIMMNLLVRSNLLKSPVWFRVREDEISDL
jgi:preprotein translocase subunit SecD